MNKNYRYLSFLLLLFLLSACQQVNNTDQVDNTNKPTITETNGGYPDPANNEAVSGYPDSNSDSTVELPPYPDANTNATNNLESYPATTPEPVNLDGIRFSLNKPLSASDLNITGTAPENLSLAIVDVTYAGTVLGIGRSDDKGEFSIPVQELIEGHRIGLALAEVPEGKSYNEVVVEFYPYRGAEYQNVPNIGVFFDTTLVGP
ncbi:MAG: hypothetical protein DWQ04_20910 [Chloroflexi bacterium]|nr:MAG: hypothetical protein DWQ04_20910 [Chloroflexota bacterium]